MLHRRHRRLEVRGREHGAKKKKKKTARPPPAPRSHAHFSHLTPLLSSPRIAELLHTSSLLAYVGAGHTAALTPRRLALSNTARGGATIAELPFAGGLVGLRLNRARLVAVLAGATHVYALESLEALAVLPTGPNAGGVAALSDGVGGDQGAPGRLALPAPPPGRGGGAAQAGRVRVFELREGPPRPGPGGSAGALAPSVELDAHRSPLACAAWSADASVLATASTRGTVIRLWSFPAGVPVGAVRRGASSAVITDLAFLGGGGGGALGGGGGGGGGPPALLAAATAHGSVHLFRLEGAGWKGRAAAGPHFSATAAALASFAPSALVHRRADAVIRLPAPTSGSIVALHPPRRPAAASEGGGGGVAPPPPTASPDSGATVCVVTAEGVLYEFGVAWPAEPSPPGGGREKERRGVAARVAAAWAGGSGKHGEGGGGGEGRAAVALEREMFVGRV